MSPADERRDFRSLDFRMTNSHAAMPSEADNSVPPTAPRGLTIPGLHAQLAPLVVAQIEGTESAQPPRVLDLGAGPGGMSYRLQQAGLEVEACDLFPELFQCPNVACRRADAHQPLPYQSSRFDAVVAIEVVEHLESQLALFGEVYRLLKPGGKFFFTTPNIASLKSRLSYLLTGYFYSHGPLDPDVDDPVSQHIGPTTPDRYRFLLARSGLKLKHLTTDRFQRSSLGLAWLVPLIWTLTRLKFSSTPGTQMENAPGTLFGRTLVGVAQKGPEHLRRAA